MEGSQCPSTMDRRHKFTPFLVATLPPDENQIRAADVESYSTGAVVKTIVESMTAKRYLVACEHCGKTIGGYSGMSEPTIEHEEPAKSPVLSEDLQEEIGEPPHAPDTLIT